MSKVEVNQISSQCGSTLTIGQSGDTVTLACGATQTGFGKTGAVNWDTTAKTASFTAVSGNGYFVNTTSGAVTVTLPASPSAGAIVGISDYNNTASTNAITIARNGSNINGNASDLNINKNSSGVELVYVDSTTGWQNITTANPTDVSNPFMVATGGTVTCCGDYKIHTFTSPGTFTVNKIACVAAQNIVSYMVVAGGGGGGAGDVSGAGGAGGFREYKGPSDSYTASPLNGNPGGTAVTVTATSYPITVGAGGAAGTAPASNGTNGANSIFSTITSAGGGGGANGDSSGPAKTAGSGGSGGGKNWSAGTVGSGNTPPVSPSQGNPGGDNAGPSTDPAYGSGGGGGATAAGGDGSPSIGGSGGAGATTSISGSSTAYAGGGGGARNDGGTQAPGGTGGGGIGGNNGTDAGCGTANTGGGGGGLDNCSPGGGNGGSGIVVIRYKYQ
jgi:hypothetical protein